MIKKSRTRCGPWLAILPGVLLFAAALHAQDARSIVSVIPAPALVQPARGSLELRGGLRVDALAADADAESATRYLQTLLATTHDAPLIRSGPKPGIPGLTFQHREARKPAQGGLDESYALDITPNGVRITAGSRAGYLYGVVSLWQMMAHAPGPLPAVHIEDAPRFRWRGLMLDSARHLQRETFILQMLDYMAQHKLNTLHWHLTDDQGWRIEIKRYPRLTSVGGFRTQVMPVHQPGRGKPAGLYGGFYTQIQIRRIVAYAKARKITVVPEIEMPGHATAALIAYPQFRSSTALVTSMPQGWGVHPNLFNTDDATLEFLQNILAEVIELFPSEYIHVGGDEAVKDQWKANAAVQARMESLGIKDEDAMQSWLIGRMDKFLTAHGRRMVGWDEILQGGLSANATVMSWRGMEGGISAAKQGHDAVLTPRQPMYFDFIQSDATDEPAGRNPVNSLADVYHFKALPTTLTPAEQAHILGVQGSLWTEYVITDDRAEHMLFPRAAALAELAWSPDSQRNFEDFLHRLPADLRRSEDAGVHLALSIFEVQARAFPTGNGDHATLELATQGGLGQIHYTLDGSPVTQASPVFQGSTTVPMPSDLHALAFDGGTPLGQPVEQKLTLSSSLRRDSRALDSCTGTPTQMEQDPPRNVERPVFRVVYSKPCWIYRRADLDRFSGVTLGMGSTPYVFYSGSRPLPLPGKASTTTARVVVHVDRCDGTVLATVPLAPAYRRDGVTALPVAALRGASGLHDLCLAVENPDDPGTVWLLNYIQPQPK